MECRTVERLGRLEKHWEHMGSEGVKRVGVWMWVVERVGSENEVEYQGSENDEYQNSEGE